MTSSITKLREAVEAGEAKQEDFTAAFLDTWPQRQLMAYHDKSLDAAKALHDALLPGWDWRVEENVNGYVVHIGPAREEFTASVMAVSFESAARCWLVAILKALEAQEADQ